MNEELKQIREALADYMQSEGCSCCRNDAAHTLAKSKLARLLRVPKYEDGSGCNFNKFSSQPL